MRCPTRISQMPKLTFSHYVGREHAYIKHYLLAQYLSRWVYKTGSKWDPIVFIDGFAGPWGARDNEFSDASFGIAIRSMNEAVAGLAKVGRATHGVCVFVEKQPKAFARLDEFARRQSTESVRAIAFKGRFTKTIPAINQYLRTIGSSPFKLVFLDQTGWAGVPMDQLSRFVRGPNCELFFNVMTSFLTRFVNREQLASSYHSLYGRYHVIDSIRSLPKGTGQREQAAVDEYCKSLRDLCRFKYVSQSVIMDTNSDRIRYFFVFATNSVHGIEVFKNAEAQAAAEQDEVRHGTRIKKQSQFGLPFGGPAPRTQKVLDLRRQYVDRTREAIISRIVTSETSKLSYDDVYGHAMMFPLVRRVDLDGLLKELEPSVRLELQGSNRKKARLFKGDHIIVVDRRAITDLFSR